MSLEFFVNPEYKKIYNSILDNKKFIDYLYKIGALITPDDYYENYGFPKKPEEYKDAEEFVSEENTNTIKNLAQLIYDNSSTIKEKSIDELVYGKILFKEINRVLGFDIFEELDYFVYRQIYFIYKNTFTDNFFQNNWHRFFPEVEVEQLEENDAAMAFVEALMIEFDKLNEIIDESKKFHSYKDIPFEYINYLSQLLGFEQGQLSLEDEEKIRELSSNILDVYKLRGSTASFDLLFNFLGFNVKVVQYYFDRRYYYSYNEENTETSTNEFTDYRYFLTANNPADNISEFFPITEVVYDKDFVKPLSFENFTDLVERYGINCVLGYSDNYTFNGVDKTDDSASYTSFIDDRGNKILKGYSGYYNGPKYTYFKTNVIDISPTKIDKSAENFTLNELAILTSLLKFLVPEFWKKHYVVNVNLGEGIGKGLTDNITLNGDRSYEKVDGKEIMNDGFRMLDSQDWFTLDEKAYNESELFKFDSYSSNNDEDHIKSIVNNDCDTISSKIKDEKSKTILAWVESDDTIKEYIILRDNDLLFTSIPETSNNEEKKYVTVKSFNSNGELGDTFYVEESVAKKNIYYNSVGEKYSDKKDELYNSETKKGKLGAFVKRIKDNRFLNINTTKGIGSMEKIGDIANDQETYLFFKISSDENARTWPFVKSTHLYLPKDRALFTPSNFWNSKSKVDFFGFEGNTLKKRLLSTEEKICFDNKENYIVSTIYGFNNSVDKDKEQSLNYAEEVNIKNLTWVKIDVDNKDSDSTNLLQNDLYAFVKNNNVINYDYVNNGLYISKSKIEDIMFGKDIENDYGYNIVYKNNNGDPILLDLFRNANSTNDYYLQKVTLGENKIEYEVFKLKEIVGKVKTIDNGKENSIYLNEMKYTPLFSKSNIDKQPNGNDLVEVGTYRELYSVNNGIKISNSLDNYIYAKVKRDPVNLKYEILINQPSENRIFLCSSNAAQGENLKETEKINNREQISSTNVLKMPTTMKMLDENNEFISYINNDNEAEIGDFYFKYNNYNDSDTSSSNRPSKLEGFEMYKWLLNARTKKISQLRFLNRRIGKKIISEEDNNIYEIISDCFYSINSTDNKYDFDMIVDEDVFVKADFVDKDPNEETPGNESIKYIIKDGNVIENESYFVKKGIKIEQQEKQTAVFGLKKIELIGKLEKKDGNYILNKYDHSYNGFSEEDDADNYILSNYDRIINWNILNGVKNENLKVYENLENETITRPIKYQTDKLFELEGEDNKQFVKNILNDMVGNCGFLSNKLF